jgi:hypothetical protein
MKNQLLALLVPLALFACGTHSQKQSQAAEKKEAGEVQAESLDSAQAKTVVEWLDVAEKNIGKEVLVKGVVTHVCRHSGKRCFILDNDGETSIRLEAGGQINGFNQELSGSTIVARGVLKENRLTSSYIDEWEQKTLSQKDEAEIDGNACSAELNNISKMREWMKNNNKDYYAVYYIEGLDYLTID